MNDNSPKISDSTAQLAREAGVVIDIQKSAKCSNKQRTWTTLNPRTWTDSNWFGIDFNSWDDLHVNDNNDAISREKRELFEPIFESLNKNLKHQCLIVGQFADKFSYALVHKAVNAKGEVKYSLSPDFNDGFKLDDEKSFIFSHDRYKNIGSIDDIRKQFEWEVALYSDYINGNIFDIKLLNENGEVIDSVDHVLNTDPRAVDSYVIDMLDLD